MSQFKVGDPAIIIINSGKEEVIGQVVTLKRFVEPFERFDLRPFGYHASFRNDHLPARVIMLSSGEHHVYDERNLMPLRGDDEDMNTTTDQPHEVHA